MHCIQTNWPVRKLDFSKKNVVARPLVDHKMYVLVYFLHIRLGLMKYFSNSINREGNEFNLFDKFSKLNGAKVKGGIFIGPQI